MWLLQTGELRILFDPLLSDSHMGGVFEVRPRRRIDAAALRPDFIVVSHRHPDHFDVASLRQLAALDADSVLLTSDALVERCARAVGFHTVARVDAEHTVTLEGARLLTTPSFGNEVEWGVMVATDDGVAWNQVDSVMRGAGDVRLVIEHAAGALAQPQLVDALTLGLVRWQPLLEVQPLLAGAIGFPWAAYGAVLDEVAALRAKVVVPASAGVAHASAFGWMNRAAYPVPQARFVRDAESRCATRALSGVVGSTYQVRGGQVAHDETCAPFVEVDRELVPQPFVPLAIPELRDPNLGRRAGMHDRVERWLRDVLVARLPSDLTLVLEVVYPDGRDAFTFRDGGITPSFDEDYDVLNQVAASMLCDVIDGTRHWGEVLLSGSLRASFRAYAVDENGLSKAKVAPIFLYYGLSYEESSERWVTSLISAART